MSALRACPCTCGVNYYRRWNSIRQSRVNPSMSAYAHVYQGQHDYNKHPFVPIRMELLVHVKPYKQRTYAQHCDKGYVIGMLFEHYQCQKVWMKDTHATRVSGVVWFKHKYLTNSSVSHPRKPNRSSHRQTDEDPDHWSASATTRRHGG